MANTINAFVVDGRRSEIRTHEEEGQGYTQRVTEHFEEIVPLQKKRQVTEKIIPMVTERVTEQFDGDKVNRVVEHIPTGLQGTTPQINLQDLEDALRNILNGIQTAGTVVQTVEKDASGVWSWFKGLFGKVKSAEQAVVGSVSSVTSNTVVTYALLTGLAVSVGFTIWQVFIR
jgi:hypothetical protein